MFVLSAVMCSRYEKNAAVPGTPGTPGLPLIPTPASPLCPLSPFSPGSPAGQKSRGHTDIKTEIKWRGTVFSRLWGCDPL